MHPKSFYSTPKKQIKLSQSRSPGSKIDIADLEALEESFSDDDSFKATFVKSDAPIKQSPVKAHNKQFEDDFDIELSEEEELETTEIRLAKEEASQLTNLVKEFSASPTKPRSTEKIKITQLSQSFEKKPLPKLTKVLFEEDFEDSLEDDFESLQANDPIENGNVEVIKQVEIPKETQPAQTAQPQIPSVPQQVQALQQGNASSAPASSVFTSSPSYHNYETLYKRVPEVPKESTNLDMLASFEAAIQNDPFPSLSEEEPKNDDLYPQLPPLQSTPRDANNLYPKMDSYNEKYDNNPPKEAQDGTAPRDFFDATHKRAQVEEPAQQEKKRKFDFTRFAQPKTRAFSNVNGADTKISQLLTKPKKRNAEISLLTQRPQFHEMDQVRNASTVSRPDSPAPQSKIVQPFILSEEQQHVVDLAKQGISLFYTGSAGTGKSILLRSMIKTLKEINPPDTVAVTASTGLAACNIGGMTLHSFAGIGLGKESATDLLKKIRRSKKNSKRWKNIKVLIIDEISMIDGELFDKLDDIARRIRRCDEPFGGIQVVVCGDFFQLPPVSKKEEQPATFAFDSFAWKRCIKLTITLQKVFRQQGDMEFIEMLNEMRIGKLSEKSIREFMKLERELPETDIEPAELFCTRFEVDRANKTRLDKLESEIKTYTAWDGGNLEDPQQRERLLANFMAPKLLHLKTGAQVMMIKNIDESLVNGSLGKVIDFIDQETYLTYEKVSSNFNLDDEEIEKDIAKVKEEQMGKEDETMEKPEGKLEETVFEFFNEIDSNDPDVRRNIQMKKDLMNKLHESSRGKKLPLVRFTTPDGQKRTVLVHPETWSVEDEHEKPLVTRMQLPLILAWALSIHKSQGQTLPKVCVNLKRVFEKGQAYVALSRAVSRNGLQVLHFNARKVEAHDRVLQFYAQLKSAEDSFLEQQNRRKLELHQNEIDDAMGGSFEDLEDEELGDEQYVDAPSPSSFAENSDYIPLMATQDDSTDNIVLNRRSFRKRGND